MSFGGLSSGIISVDATAEDMTQALEAIPTVGQVLVTRKEQQDTFGYQWTVTFLNSEWWTGGDRYFDMPLLTLSNVEGTQISGFTSSVSSSTASSTFIGTTGAVTVSQLVVAMSGYEQQSIDIQVSSGVMSGTYALSTAAHSTRQLDFSAGTEEIRTALRVFTGDVIVRRQNMQSGSGFTLFFIFTEELGSSAVLVADTTFLASTDGSAISSATYRARVPGTLPVLGSAYYNSTVVQVADEFSNVNYQITNLVGGLHYYVRVSAFNGAGATFGASLNGYPILTQASKRPAAVGDVALTAVSDSVLKVSWKEPTDNGGSPIASYLVECDLASTVNEVQVVSINSSSSTLSGTFSLSFMGFATSAIPYDASASRMEAAIESLANIGNVQVTLSQTQSASTMYSSSWTVTFLDNVAPMGLLTVSSNDLIGTSVTAGAYRIVKGLTPSFSGGSIGISQRPLLAVRVSTTPTVQIISVNASSSDLSGYFTVMNSGEVSQPISVYATASEVQSILSSMFTVGVVNVTLSELTLQTTAPQSNYGSSWTVTFSGIQYRSLLVSTGLPQGAVAATGGSLTGSSAIVAVECVSPNEVLPTQYSFKGLTAGGQYVARVTASNALFNSKAAVSMVAAAPRLSSPSTPLRAYMTVLSDTQISVYWDRPTSNGGAAITGYSVDWDVTLNFGSDSMAAFVSSSPGDPSSSYVISGLTPGSPYAVRVAAYNSQGYSPFVLALPKIAASEVQVVTVPSSQTFDLTFNDRFAFETTSTIPRDATASQVQSALQALTSIRSVIVSKEDQSSGDLFDLTLSSSPYYQSYRITFIDAGFPSLDYDLLPLVSSAVAVTVVTVSNGESPISNFITTTTSAPSAPESVVVTVVSSTELGVTWQAPLYSGGLPVAKYLVEWDVSPYFLRVNTSSFHAVVNASTAATMNSTYATELGLPVKYTYQITALSQLATFVRVSAFNGMSGYGGYSKAITGVPLNSTDKCNTMPIHCNSTPATQVLYLPVTPTVALSALEVSNRLDITWTQPLVDMYGFNTETILPHTPSAASAYRVQYATQKDFSDATTYDIPMIIGDGLNESCHTGCTKTIGVEIQNITVASGSGEVLNGGTFSLLYLGPQSQVLFVTVQEGSSTVRLFDSPVNVTVNDFLRIRGGVYQIALVISQDTVQLTANFTGGFTDVVQAYYLKSPGVSSSVLSYDATADEVDLYLEAQLTALYPLYVTSNFAVARQTLDMGYSWLVTFTGEMFSGEVDSLMVISTSSPFVTNIPLTPFTTVAGVTSLSIVTASPIVNAGDLPQGTAVFVRIAAINAVGLGPYINFVPSSNGLSVGSIVPRSLPGLPLNVEVFAVPESTGDSLLVVWEAGEDYGSAIITYQIEVRETNTTTFITRAIIPAITGQSMYTSSIIVNPFNTYEIRVRAVNDLGGGGPAWFQKIGSHDTNAIMTLVDFNTGAQRATPTCQVGLEECLEANSTSILPRGLPGQSVLTVPTYPKVDSSQPFTESSGMVVFAKPVVNGDIVDKWRVEWSLDSVFTSTVTQSSVTTETYFNITGLSQGTPYYIRVVAHNSLGYGEPSLSYPFKPTQQPGVVKEPTLGLANDALDLVTYATSLNVSWYYPMIMSSEGDLVGDGGDPVTSYLIEWSTSPFTAVTAMVQNISIPCQNASDPSQTFSLSLTTANLRNKYDTSNSFHAEEFPVEGTYYSANIPVAASAYDVKKIIENMPNVATVSVSKVVGTGYITWLVTFTESATVPIFSVNSSNIICAGALIYPSVYADQLARYTGGYSWQVQVAEAGSAMEEQHYHIKELLPGRPYYVQVSARNELGYGARKMTAPSVLTVPITPPSAPTQAEGPWAGPKLFLSTPTSLLVKIGPPTFDGGSLAGVFVVEWDQSSTFNSGASRQATGMVTIPAYTLICSACVKSIDFLYNVVDPQVEVAFDGSADNARQLQTGARIVIVTTDDNVPYTFTVGDSQANATVFTLMDTGRRVTRFNSTSSLADVYLLGADYEISGLATGSQYFVRVKAENSAGVCDPSMAFINDCGTFTRTSPASAIPRGVSEAPSAVLATVVDATSIQVSWTAPASIGDSIVSYRVDAFTSSVKASTASSSFFGDQEIQVISVPVNTTGTFTLSYGSYDKQLPGTVDGGDAMYTFYTSEDLSVYLEPEIGRAHV